ncbi:MAG: methyltransferase domain-containing protein [Alphaproteobacteria bacterium]|nr:methyltransferase domain-containing protein [Alphaproteobacteria bacterium]
MDARGGALRAFLTVLGGETLDAAFAVLDEKAELEPRDRAFARLLVLTALRRLGQIDDAIAHCVERPDDLPPRERAILRLGAAQLLFLGTPAFAAVNGAVQATRSSALKGLVNAVLRRLSREGPAIFAQQDAPQLNTPQWLWQQWADDFGAPAARAIAMAHLDEPPLDLSVARDAMAWAERLGATMLPTGSLRLRDAGPVADLPGYHDGAWWVQDAAAALPAHVLMNALPEVEGAEIADLCAAPGGKTAQLAAAGARVTAVDRDPRRLERVAENLRRLRLSATLLAADAAAWAPGHAFDAVLLDAPCTATGTMRRNPDIALHKGPDSAAALDALQDALLAQAATLVAPGGVLVYCVCSLDRREGAGRVEAFLGRHPDFERIPTQAVEVGGLTELLTRAGDLRTLPCHLAEQGGMDGFFAARMRRDARLRTLKPLP